MAALIRIALAAGSGLAGTIGTIGNYQTYLVLRKVEYQALQKL